MNDERFQLPSASSLYRVYHCPGSVAAERATPAVPESERPEAAEGTAIHEALEEGDFSELGPDAANVARAIDAMVTTAIDQWWRDLATQLPPKLRREERLWLPDNNGNPIGSAKLDIFAISGSDAIGVDYKTGYLPVPPASVNIQLRVQAIALWRNYPQLKRITMATAQYRFTGLWSDVPYTLDDLTRAEQELFFALWRAEQPDAPRTAGQWCRYCLAKANCPEAAAMSMLPLVIPKAEALTKESLQSAVLGLPIETLVDIHTKKSLIEGVLGAVSNRLRQFSNEELEKVGYKKVPREGNRTVASIKALLTSLAGAFEMDEKAILAHCKVKVPSLYKHLIDKLQESGFKNGEGKPATKEYCTEHLDTVLGGVITRGPHAPSLVPIKKGKHGTEIEEGS